MRMLIDVVLDYRLRMPGTALLVIEAAGAMGQDVVQSTIDLGNPERIARVPAEEGIGERIIIRAKDRLQCRYNAELHITRPRPDLENLHMVEVEDMPGDALRYLLPSVYCPVDRFFHYSNSRFGGLSGGRKVAAMRDWIEYNLCYVAGASDANTTAADTFLDRRGVCRDYAHLMISLCRAAQIPTRFASVYAPGVKPQDFHAVVEVYLDGEWHLVDPTGMAQADNMALVAVGRDAADVAFLTTTSMADLQTQTVAVTRI
ncbi:transglutaminase family protein [Paracoccus sp. JM45]|uniref:transglutaminase-like domain-containing protein n=1 Tax=Paracoccus sp. JM45 TaxID=2283626 RepID=UPI000E6CB0C2|nr:transglutaminase family protein [Paracoccus sp. JM45]RJE79755.1 transglutaminase family protein [Paracoccus sp. JM45]